MTTPNVPHPYAYADLVRDLSPVFFEVVKATPVFASLLKYAPYFAKQHKHEWVDHQHGPETTTLTKKISSDAMAILEVASVSPFQVNSVIRFEGYREIMQVLSINTTEKKVTVTRGYGSSTKETEIANGTSIRIVGHPKVPGTRAALSGKTTPGVKRYNYTEIIDGEAVIPRNQGRDYNVPADEEDDPVGAALNYEVENEMRRMARRFNNALIYGRPVESTSDSVPGTMGGLLYFHELGSNRIDAKGNPVSEDLLSQAFKACLAGGAEKVNTLLCHQNQAEVISGLYESQLRVLREDTQLGYTIYEVAPRFPIAGYVTKIIVDPDFPPTDISIFDIDTVIPVLRRAITDENSRAGGDDFEARRIIMEVTSEFRNVDVSAALLHDLGSKAAA